MHDIWRITLYKEMANKKKKSRKPRNVQFFTLCLSTTMVLVLIGMVVFSVLSAYNLSAYVKENLTVTMILNEDVTNPEAKKMCMQLKKKHYISHITYISKEQALKEQTQAMGKNPSEFLGSNPFLGSIELQLFSDYANNDSLKWIERQLKSDSRVSEITYPRDLMDSVNRNLQKINFVLLILAALLAYVSFALINNSVRLSVYARRFSIHTMKLVGASWSFIRWPFIRSAIYISILAAFMACAVLAGGLYALYTYEPDILLVITWEMLAITAGAILLVGFIITMFCTWLSVNKFLRMKAGELYKI